MLKRLIALDCCVCWALALDVVAVDLRAVAVESIDAGDRDIGGRVHHVAVFAVVAEGPEELGVVWSVRQDGACFLEVSISELGQCETLRNAQRACGSSKVGWNSRHDEVS